MVRGKGLGFLKKDFPHGSRTSPMIRNSGGRNSSAPADFLIPRIQYPAFHQAMKFLPSAAIAMKFKESAEPAEIMSVAK